MNGDGSRPGGSPPSHGRGPAERAKRWFAVQTKPSKERLALHHLRNQDFEAFCPFRRTSKRIGTRSVAALEPFFPSYAFVRLDPARERWRSVNGTIGVARLVSFGSDPSALPDGLIERFRSLCDTAGELAFDEQLLAGEQVRITGGPFDALCGRLITAEPRKRVTVLLELMAGATEVQLRRDQLVRV